MNKNNWYPVILALNIVGLLAISVYSFMFGQSLILGLGAATFTLNPEPRSYLTLTLLTAFMLGLIYLFYFRSKNLSKRLAAFSLLLASPISFFSGLNHVRAGTNLVFDITPVLLLAAGIYLLKNARTDEQ